MFSDIFRNHLLMNALLAWATAQILKFFIYLAVNRTIDWKRLTGDGGMPSGHSATVTALAVTSGLEYGYDSPAFAVCVVLASEGYPGSYEKGKVILGIEEAEELEGVTVFHAGTARNADGELVTAGGRVLNVVALGDSFDDAREKAYEACNLINFEGKQYRTDIGKKAAAGREAWN